MSGPENVGNSESAVRNPPVAEAGTRRESTRFGGLVALLRGYALALHNGRDPAYGADTLPAGTEQVAHRSAGPTHVRLMWGRVAIALMSIGLLYLPIMPNLVHEWATFPSLSHGFAVPLIAGYLVWTRRQDIAGAAQTRSWHWLALVATGLALYVAGTRGSEPFLARVSLPMTLLGGVALVNGWGTARQMVAGILYLFFMIPLPYLTLKTLTDQMRLFDAAVTAGILPWLGVPVFQEGYMLHLPNMTLEVADVCSSIPAIASFLALAAAFGYVNRRRAAVQTILILSAVPFGILSNIIRITTTAAGVYFIGPIAIHNVIHMWNGTTVFLMTLGFLIVLDAGLRRVWVETR